MAKHRLTWSPHKVLAILLLGFNNCATTWQTVGDFSKIAGSKLSVNDAWKGAVTPVGHLQVSRHLCIHRTHSCVQLKLPVNDSLADTVKPSEAVARIGLKRLLDLVKTFLKRIFKRILGRRASSTIEDGSAPSITSSCGGQSLEKQPIPPFLMPYHETTIALTESALSDATLRCTRAVQYGPKTHQTLDVWAPTSGGTSMPIVIGIHGGGWEVGYPEWAGFPARQICATPALYIAPAYKLGFFTEQAWPSSRDDLLAAIRWVIEHAKELGGDPSRIILTGHSAGGHLASCVGLNPKLLQEANISPAAIRALFLVSCPLGLRAEDFAPAPWLNRFWVTRLLLKLLYRRTSKFLRVIVGSPPDLRAAEEASVLATVSDADAALLPPFVHIGYGGKGDFPICRPHAKRLEALLSGSPSGPRVEILEISNATHFDTHYMLANSSSEWNKALRQLLATI